MANFVWTAILYTATLGIVYVSYRAFVMDRKAEREGRTSDMINRSYGAGGGKPGIAFTPPRPSRLSPIVKSTLHS
jgi:hypothetical protein